MSMVCHCCIFEQNITNVNNVTLSYRDGAGFKMESFAFFAEASAFDWRIVFNVVPVVQIRNPKVKVFVLTSKKRQKRTAQPTPVPHTIDPNTPQYKAMETDDGDKCWVSVLEPLLS